MRGEHISFYVVFCSSCVQRDYYYRGRLHTDFEERLREKRGKMYVFPITGGPPQREEVLYEKENFFKFHWVCVFVCVCVCVCVCVFVTCFLQV